MIYFRIFFMMNNMNPQILVTLMENIKKIKQNFVITKIICIPCAEEIVDRPCVGTLFVHGDDGIEEDAEIGSHVEWGQGRHGGSQVSACRKAHDAHIVGIDAPNGGTVTNGHHSMVGIGQRDFGISLGHTVLQREVGDAALVEPGCTVGAFLFERKKLISSTRAGQDGSPRWLNRQRAIEQRLAIGRILKYKLP